VQPLIGSTHTSPHLSAPKPSFLPQQTRWPVCVILGDNLEIIAIHFQSPDGAGVLGRVGESGPKPGV
jgi:hypothetical protein